jgi:hypothetical protein
MNLSHGIKIDQGSPRNPKKPARIKPLFQFVKCGLHEVLSGLADEAREASFRREKEDARFIHDCVGLGALHQKAYGPAMLASNGAVEPLF